MIQIKYRSNFTELNLQPIKLQIPGWSGCDRTKTHGSKAQPWHCIPFTEAATYGFELLYPYESDLVVTNENGKAKFECDWSKNTDVINQINNIPVGTFADGHYGLNALLDIQVPDNYVLRLESHPRFFTDHTYQTPCVVPGHLQTNWWTSYFFVVFKLPQQGQKHIFQKSKPYAQVLVLPKNPDFTLQKMTDKEANKRAKVSSILKNKRFKISKLWQDSNNNCFDDTYKNLANFCSKNGSEKTLDLIASLESFNENHKKIKNKFITKKPRTEDARLEDGRANMPSDNVCKATHDVEKKCPYTAGAAGAAGAGCMPPMSPPMPISPPMP